MWRIFPLDIFSPHLSCGEISPRDRFSPPFSCGEIFHLTYLSPHFSCGEISPCDRVSPHLSSGEFSHLTCHGENFSTWPIFSPQTASVASVTNIRYVKECSNQEVEENEPALKFNFTLEFNWGGVFLNNFDFQRALMSGHVDNIAQCEQCLTMLNV